MGDKSRLTNPQFDTACTRIKQLEAERDDLLARIHRDGGHYVLQHGVVKALDDADKIVATLFLERDELMTELELVRRSLKLDGVGGTDAEKVARLVSERDRLRVQVARLRQVRRDCSDEVLRLKTALSESHRS